MSKALAVPPRQNNVCLAALVPTWPNQALGSQGRNLCGTAKSTQREDTARVVVDGPPDADQMRASVRDVEGKEVMYACR